ncbi:unnamed protein product [Peniophora sp. CBMAI 1063]|nr:unnamed protein product [Peniophora sp. CBMAI 1063]
MGSPDTVAVEARPRCPVEEQIPLTTITSIDQKDDGISALCRLLHSVSENLRYKSHRSDQLDDLLLVRPGDWSPQYMDLSEAVLAARLALDVSLDDQATMYEVLDHIGSSLRARFDLRRDQHDLKNALLIRRFLIPLIPYEHSYKCTQLIAFADELLAQFECLGNKDVDILNRVISTRNLVMKLTGDSDEDKHRRLVDLGTAFRTRYKQSGEPGDLTAALKYFDLALEALPSDCPYESSYLNSLGNALYDRFIRLGEIDDLARAKACLRRAVALTDEGHTEAHTWMNNLGNVLHASFKRLGERADLDEALQLHRQVSRDTPDGHPELPARMSDLGRVLQAGFEHYNDTQYLDEAIAAHERAVALTSDEHPDRAAWLNGLGSVLYSRFMLTRKIEDLKSSIQHRSHAIELTPNADLEKATRLCDLGSAFRALFTAERQPSDLKRAIENQQRAVDTTPDGLPDKPTFLYNLGITFRTCYGHDQSREHFEAAITYLREAALQSSRSDASIRLQSAVSCVELLAENTQHPVSVESMLEAHGRVIHIKSLPV